MCPNIRYDRKGPYHASLMYLAVYSPVVPIGAVTQPHRVLVTDILGPKRHGSHISVAARRVLFCDFCHIVCNCY